MAQPQVLAERRMAPGVTWQARVDERGRLGVVVVVAASSEPVTVPLLTEAELQELLAEGQRHDLEPWRCASCGAMNDRGRHWCRVCSDSAV